MAADLHLLAPAIPSLSRRKSPSLRRLAALWLAFGWSLALAAETTLQGLLGAAEYQAAGLDKLTRDERAALLRTLQSRGLAPRPASSPATAAAPAAVAPPAATAVPAQPPPAPASAPVRPESPPPAPAAEKKGLWARIKDFGAEQLPLKDNKDLGEVTEVEAQLTEPFRGLQGHTVFRLDNGQVWQQRIPENYYLGSPIPNPTVILRRTRFGYRLFIPAVDPGFDVAVKRIQ